MNDGRNGTKRPSDWLTLLRRPKVIDRESRKPYLSVIPASPLAIRRLMQQLIGPIINSLGYKAPVKSADDEAMPLLTSLREGSPEGQSMLLLASLGTTVGIVRKHCALAAMSSTDPGFPVKCCGWSRTRNGQFLVVGHIERLSHCSFDCCLLPGFDFEFFTPSCPIWTIYLPNNARSYYSQDLEEEMDYSHVECSNPTFSDQYDRACYPHRYRSQCSRR